MGAVDLDTDRLQIGGTRAAPDSGSQLCGWCRPCHNDQIMRSEGGDYVDDGDGYDTIDYSGSSIHVGEGGHAEGDTLVNIKAVIGSAHDERIDASDISSDAIAHRAYGDGGDDVPRGYDRNYLSGGTGEDTLVSHRGGTVRGGPGGDTFTFGEVDDATIEDFNTTEGNVIELSSIRFRGITKSDVQATLDDSSGGVLDLSLLGDTGSYDRGSITLLMASMCPIWASMTSSSVDHQLIVNPTVG